MKLFIVTPSAGVEEFQVNLTAATNTIDSALGVAVPVAASLIAFSCISYILYKILGR